jgi:hypothetical protein
VERTPQHRNKYRLHFDAGATFACRLTEAANQPAC